MLDTIGNTPMIRVASLSDATGCDVLIKCEFANPGGSVKDRVALKIVKDAMANGTLRRGGVVTEGTAGSTGVSVAMVANALGCEAFLSLPDDAAAEKSQLMRAFGARVEPVRPVAITHENHFVNVARRRAEAAKKNRGEASDETSREKGGLFCDQFENLANARAHFQGTGPEIWEQARWMEPANGTANPLTFSFFGKRFFRKTSRPALDAFVCACGTGGTLAGVASFLKRKDARIQCFLVDPQGSSLYNKVTRGVLYTHQEAEGKRLRNPFDTVTEGVGINRLTKNFAVALGTEALFPGENDAKTKTKTKTNATSDGVGSQNSLISGAFRCSDREAVEMSRFLARTDGLFLGSSSCVNIVGAVKAARRLGPGHRVVTIACDGGGRHLSKFWSDEYLEKHGLTPTARGLEFLEET